MFCENCGQKNPDNARFCSGCGKPSDAATPAPMAFASEVGTRFKGAISRNNLLAVTMIGLYLGTFSLGALVLGTLVGVLSLLATVLASGPVGELASLASGGIMGKLATAGIFGILASLLGAYGLASARGLLARQAWARHPAMITAIVWAVLAFFMLFAAGKISGSLLLMILLQTAALGACAFALSQASVKDSLATE
jgi:hypothetical protein